jgi:hypothetical protein
MAQAHGPEKAQILNAFADQLRAAKVFDARTALRAQTNWSSPQKTAAGRLKRRGKAVLSDAAQ